ncbi:MAG: efflux RND transporter permease subunit [Gammaproteobacteria bacterium]
MSLLKTFADRYAALVYDRPRLVFAAGALVLLWSAWFAQDFRLDVSAEALVLENDAALDYYREITSRYVSDDYLIVAYTPAHDLFAPATLARIRALRNELGTLERVESVITLLDVPLLRSPPVTVTQIAEETRTLESDDVDRDMARDELLTSPLYSNRLTSPNGRTTALQVNFRRDETYWRLLNERNALRAAAHEQVLDHAGAARLARLEAEFDAYNDLTLTRQEEDIAAIRAILDDYRDDATVYLGGVPMVSADMMSFIRHDIVAFGTGVLVILAATLAVLFRRLRWITLPFLVAVAASLFSVGFLGFIGWPVTVVSSNFLSLILIFSLSLGVHLIVRYQEIYRLDPDATQRELVAETMASKAVPCLYTVLTTMVAFSSLVLSDIRPVIDFGWMMAVALAAAFVFAFTLFPAVLVLLPKRDPSEAHSLMLAITRWCAGVADRHGRAILVLSGLVVIGCVLGIRLLSVENRFIDYFHESTEIFQGMALIDRELGGTTPLDVIIDAPPEKPAEAVEENPAEELFDELFEPTEEDGITLTSHWFNTRKLRDISAVHKYLESLPDTGKVLSLHTTMATLDELDDDGMLDDFFLSLLYKQLPPLVSRQVIEPFFSEEHDQLRFSIRVRESDATLNRQQLIDQIHAELDQHPVLEGAKVSLTGMLVLYNNLLQSLFRSQILTLGAVFLAIVAAFAVLFRSVPVAAIAIVPNLLAAGLVLGLMGWIGITLDIMTITIAAITVGIAVDDTIHYVHRFHVEWQKDRDYRQALYRAHASIGRAMYYTTFTITVGFVILALSKFVPTVYFGLLTGFAMVTALVCDLLVLPALLVLCRPYGPGAAPANAKA